MTMHQALRLIAGTFVLASVALGWFVNQYFYCFTAFVGLNLLQSAFSDWCPMMTLLRKVGFKDCKHEPEQHWPKAA